MSNETKSFSYPLFRREDLNGFWALFADNLANMVIISTLCLYVFHLPKSIVFGRILPGLGFALLLGLSYYAYLAYQLAHKEQREDVTALPYGISTPVLFVYLFGVMMPVYLKSKGAGLSDQVAGMQAWQVAIAAAFLGGIIESLGAILGPFLKRVTPRAGMLGTLAGIALVYIAAVPFAEIVEHPIIGFASLAIVLVGLVARYRLPFNLPAGLVAIVVGIIVALLTGDVTLTSQPFSSISFHIPLPFIGDLWTGLHLLFVKYPALIMVILPIEIYNFIETMNNVESAEAAGDSYPVRNCQIMDGVGTMGGALFGSPFPTTVYIGHPAYKKLGGRSGYALGVGIAFLLIAMFGLMDLLHHYIPVAAVAPILVYIGINITGQAFSATPKAHAVAVAFALLPHVSSILVQHVDAAARTVSGLLKQGIPSNFHQVLLAKEYVHYNGHFSLSKGAIIIGLLWGAIVASLIDKKSLKAAFFSLAAALLTLFGIIHVPQVGIHYQNHIFYGYLLLTILLFSTQWMNSPTPPSHEENLQTEEESSEAA